MAKSKKIEAEMELPSTDLFGSDEKVVAKKQIEPSTKKEVVKQEKKVSPVKKVEEVKVVRTNVVDIIKSDTDPYAHYNTLSVYHKKCLVTTNYWRVVAGLEIIPVPPEYKYYHKMFDSRCYDLYKAKQDHKQKNKIL